MKEKKMSMPQILIIVVSILLMFGSQYLPAVGGLPAEGMQIAGIFIGTLLLWLFVDTTWPSVLSMIALCLSPLYTYSQVMSGSWGNWIVSFLIYSNMVTYILTQSGFLKRCATWFITRPLAKKSPWLFLGLLFLAPLVIGAFMSPIPTFVVFVPIIEQIFIALGYTKGEKVPQLLTLGVLATTSISTSTTPIAHTFPILAMSLYAKDTGASIDFLSYTAAGVVSGLVMFVGIFLLFRFVFRPDLSKIQELDVESLKQEQDSLSIQEKISLSTFAVVVLLWMLPGILKYSFPTIATFLNSLGTPVPAMIGVVILSLIRVEGKPMLNFKEVASKGVPWNAIILVAATMILSSALTNEDAGITNTLIGLINPLVQNMSSSIFVFIVILLTTILTNFISNTVAVTMLYSIALPIVFAAPDMGVNAAALASMIGAASCVAIATPPSTAHAALASGTGWLDTKIMFSHGMIITLLCGLVLAFIGYPIASVLM